MLRDAREYGSLNVHMRCKRTELFTAGTYNLLASAADFNNLRQMLANTKYDDIIGSEMVKEYPNLIEIDRRLVQNFVDQFNLSEVSSLPVWSDEYKNGKKTREKNGFYKTVFDRNGSNKGALNK